MSVLILNHDDVHAALEPEECERAMAAVLTAHGRGEAYFPLRSVMIAPGAPGLMGLMPAYSAGTADGDEGVFALKAICLMRGNPARGLDAHQGIVTLFDHDTGVPTAVINASAITEIRTAAVTAVATRALSREDSTVLAVLGAGVQAGAHLRAFRGMRDWRETRVYAPTAAHAQAVADAEPGATVAPSAREAVEGADVVVVATSADEPVLEHAWIARARTSTRSAPASRTHAKSRSRRSPPRRSTATAASRCETKPASSSSRSRRGRSKGRSTSAASSASCWPARWPAAVTVTS